VLNLFVSKYCWIDCPVHSTSPDTLPFHLQLNLHYCGTEKWLWHILLCVLLDSESTIHRIWWVPHQDGNSYWHELLKNQMHEGLDNMICWYPLEMWKLQMCYIYSSLYRCKVSKLGDNFSYARESSTRRYVHISDFSEMGIWLNNVQEITDPWLGMKSVQFAL